MPKGSPTACAARLAVALIAVAAGSWMVPARADPRAAQSSPAADSSSSAQAMNLFRAGRSLLEAKDYAAAAVKFEESFRLDPGGGTKLNLALAYELAGKTASARAAYQEALRLAERDGRHDRADEARAHLHQLEPRLSRLRVVVPVAARVAGLEILRDGLAVSPAFWDEEVVVDPGEHRIDARAPGKRPWRGAIQVGDSGDRQRVEVGALDDVSGPTEPVRASVPRAGSKSHRIGWISLAAGATGMATAGITAALAIGTRSDCPSTGCSPSLRDRVDTYNTFRTTSTVSFWVGAGLSAAGLTLLLLAPTSSESQPTVVLAPNHVAVAGRF